MQNGRRLLVVAGVFVALLTLSWLARRPGGGGGGASGDGFPEAPLVSVDGQKVSLKECPTAKCLTAYVAPWCGVCRASTALIVDLKGYLRERGVAMRVVVGRDRAGAMTDYARELGPDTLLDPSGLVDVGGGVPQFIVSDASGRILLRQPGVPRIVQPPVPVEALQEMADFLRLP
ncbi:MAG: hypothetical protein A2X36_11475 [Elusimicrobia bacterium GWA2_69_24]|nr:MAG: hypothetical protein A2X36_11475 [Elusimicrobia bacterium GWA2_69_24]